LLAQTKDGEEPPPYQYIVLHASCAKRPGVAAAQAAHAATQSLQNVPVDERLHVVILVCESSAELEQLGSDLKLVGIPHSVVHEPDEPYNGAATAVGIAPMDRLLVQSFVAHLKVFR